MQHMPELVFDTCVLSNFALTDTFLVLERLYRGASWVTSYVSDENINGIEQGYERLRQVQGAIKEGWMRKIDIYSEEEMMIFRTLSISLGRGEASSIAAAKTRHLVFACDDKLARNEAKKMGVALTGTIGILIKTVRVQILSLSQANKILKRMIHYGFYSPVRVISAEMLRKK
jgi:predicted nucleic acid-binding protein